MFVRLDHVGDSTPSLYSFSKLASQDDDIVNRILILPQVYFSYVFLL